MASDKFKSVAATFQIFKDGEAVSARKLDGIIRKTQDGFDKIERSLGDMWDYGLALSGLPLFHNSIARAIGPSDVIVHPPIRIFDTPQTLPSRDQGLSRYPYSTVSAPDVGNRSLNLLPSIDQTNKIGIGCTNDNGTLCIARFDNIYNEQKNILRNGLFNSQIKDWETSGVLYDGEFARLDTTTRYNTLADSEEISSWTAVSGSLTDRAFNSPTGGSNVYMFTPDQDGTDLVYIESAGQPIAASTDWCFSVWLATSGQQTTTFLEIDEATHVRGTQGRGSIDPAGSIYAVDISGMTWNRYYVHGTFASARTSGVARIHLGRGNVTGQDDKVFIWGAQLEPTTSPSTYQATTGFGESAHVGETWIGQTFSAIPKKWYQASIEWNQISGTSWSLVHDGTVLISESTDTSKIKTFRGPVSNLSRFAGSIDTNIHIYVSGSTADTGPMKLTSFRIDPGTPCHALNCPGFSAYEQTRNYRATLPVITNANSQFFGEQLQFPDEFSLSSNSKLPANIMGVFDHEQNQTVPNRLVDWRLANWPIGNNIQTGFITDPGFLTYWTTGVLNTYPTEFNPTDTSNSGLVRDSILTSLAPAEDDVLALSPAGWWAADDPWASGIGTTPADGQEMNVDFDYWNDKSGNGRHQPATSGTGDVPAWYNTVGVSPAPPDLANGKPTFSFVGTRNVGSGMFSSISIGTNANWTIYALIRMPDTALWPEPIIGQLLNTHPADISTYIGIQDVAGVRTSTWTGSEPGPGSSTGITWGGEDFSGTSWRRIKHTRSSTTQSLYVDDNLLTKTTNFDPGHASVWNQLGARTQIQAPGGTYDYNAWMSEIIVFDKLLTAAEQTLVEDYLDGKYATGPDGIYASDIPVDRLKIYATSGNTQGIEKTFTLDEDEVATWEYTIRGTSGPAGILETYTALSGSVDVDTNLTGTWTSLTSGTSLQNTYQVSGLLPGETVWSKLRNSMWTITRSVRATSANTFLALSLELVSDEVATQTVIVDSFDLHKQSSISSQFEYCADPILGLNWDGQATHVRDENLFQFSDNLLLWESTGLTRTIDTDSSTRVRITGAGGSFYQSISGADLLDDVFTLTWQSSAPNITSGLVSVTQGSVVQNSDWTIYNAEVDHSVIISGIVYETGDNMEVRWTLYGDDATVANPQLVHGSGIVDYIGTSSVPTKKYRRVIQPLSPQTVDVTWASGYALVQGRIIQTTQLGTPRTDGSTWIVENTRGFPAQGVIRIAGQEYGYRLKTSGAFEDTIPGWRGTIFNPSIVASGSRVTSVSIPQSITKIDPTTKEIAFQDIIPAPVGDWANNLGLQIYNTHISNLDRFSLQSSAVPVTKATGNLLTSFVQHVSDHRRHIRMSQLCGLILDSSSWAASPFIMAEASIVDQTVTELTEQAQLNVVAKRFVPNSDKEVTIFWGDGQSTVVSGTGNDFPRNSHTYDLKQIATPRTYTIRVIVKDLDLDFSRTTTQAVTVSPKINPAGQSTKSTIKAGAKILLPATFGTTAGAKIKGQNSSVSTAGAKMVLP